MPRSLDQLIAELDSLLEELGRAEVEHAAAIDAVAEVHRRGAVNLVHYTALRQHDRRDLQNDLMDLGATSLATTEAHVRAKVLAARNVLSALRGDPGPWPLRRDQRGPGRGRQDPERQLRRHLRADATRSANPDHGHLAQRCRRRSRPALRHGARRHGHRPGQLCPRRPHRLGTDGREPSCRPGRLRPPTARLHGSRRTKAANRPHSRRSTRRTVPRHPARVRQVLAPARIWFTSALNPSPPPAVAPPARRPTLPVHVDPAWLRARHPGDVVTMRDVRGPEPLLHCDRRGPRGALAEGPQNTYLQEGERACGATAAWPRPAASQRSRAPYRCRSVTGWSSSTTSRRRPAGGRAGRPDRLHPARSDRRCTTG